MFIDWLPEVLRPWRSRSIRAKRGTTGGGYCAPDRVSANVEHLEPLQLLSAAPITQIARNDFLTSPTGYLTGPSSSPPLTVAQNYLQQHHDALGLTAGDVSGLQITSQHVSSISGATYVYYQQTYNGIAVQDSVANVVIAADGSVVSVGNRLVPNLASRINPAAPVVSPATAVVLGGAYHGLMSTTPPDPIASGQAPTDPYVFQNPALSQDDIPVTLKYVVSSQGDVRLSWNLVLRSPANPDWLDINIDGQTGEQTNFSNWTHYDNSIPSGGANGSGGTGTEIGGTTSSLGGTSNLATGTPQSNAGTGVYNVYPLPLTAPDDGIRQIQATPEDAFSSPFGWHDINGIAGADFTDTRGNNVFAQEDLNADDLGGVRPDGGASLDFDFPIDLTLAPLAYTDAATVQLFYINNIVHDLYARYGFDAASGNFQRNNYGQGGLGNDQVMADAQDGSGVNNANFGTPPDGQSGRMQMFTWNVTTPGRDGDFSNDIIVHEYGHGVSNRLTGGAADANALNALQSGGMGEGWSDFWALMFTQRVGDTQNDAIPFVTYVIGDPANGGGIRRAPYSYDLIIDPRTYADFNTSNEVHDAGEIWASALWDMNWLLINKYGFDADLYSGTAGNNRALSLVMEGLKIQPANPSFLDGRDAILAADRLLYGGANQYEIWQAFARRGMGFSASDGGSADSPVVIEAFDVPATPKGEITFDQSTYEVGDIVTITLKDIDLAGTGSQDVTVISSAGDQETVRLTEFKNGGIFIGSIVSRSSEVTDFTIDNGLLEVPRASSITVAYLDANDGAGNLNVVVSDSATFYVFDDVVIFDFSNPNGTPSNEGFIASGPLNLWHLTTGRGLDLGHSSDDSFYFGQGETVNGGGAYTPTANGTLTSPLIDLTNFTGPVFLEFNHFLELEDLFDTATVSVIAPSGTTIVASNNGTSANMPDATGGWQTMRVDLSAFAGQKVRLAFQVQADNSVQREGWYVDDVRIAAPLSTIQGTKWNDIDGDGQLDFNESGLAGWTMFLDNNDNGVLDNATTTVAATGLNLSIPDLGQVVSSVTVSNVVGAVFDVNVNLSISHTRDSDLDVFLISPAGTRIELFTDVGTIGDNFVNTTLDDQANFSINLGSAPFVGAFSPEGFLSALNGENPNGIWQLEVSDDAVGDVGTLLNWSISVSSPEASTVTDANGNYTLTAVNGGTFRVREVPQLGWIQTSPSGATLNNPNPAQVVVVPFGSIVQDVDFYNQFIFPVVTLPNPTVIYTENEPPVTIEPAALLSDANSVNFGGGSLVVTLTANASADDRLTIRNQGNGTLQIGVDNNTVQYEGTTIGTFGGGVGANSLVINFNSNATAAAVRALLRSIQFECIGENPSPLTRTVEFVITDDTGGASVPVTKQIIVVPVNDAPVVTLSNTILTYPENSPPLPLDVFATVSDPDSSDFNGGFLTVSLIGNEGGQVQITQRTFSATDLPLSLDGAVNSVPVTSSTVVAGIGGTLSDVNVTLNIAHTNVADLTAYLVSPNGTRVKLFSNVGGQFSQSANFTNTTFDDEAAIPILGFQAVAPFTGSFRPEKELFLLDGQNPNGAWSLEVTDAVGTFIDGTGTLISWSLGLTIAETSVNEKLAILHQGSNPGESGVVGNRVTYGGVVIGTFGGGVGTAPLNVNFNANSSLVAIQSLMQNITLEVSGEDPIIGQRQAIFVVNDGDGDSSIPQTKLIDVVTVNDAPVLTLPSGQSTYIENSLPTVLDTFATVSDIDSANFDTGVLTVSLGATAKSGDRLGIRSSGQNANQINVLGTTVRLGTTSIGTVTGGTSGLPLTVTFNGNATPAFVQALVRAITFQAVGLNPDTTPRLVSFQVTDGDGGASEVLSKAITVVQTNDPPVLTLSTAIVPPNTFPTSQVNYNANGMPVVLDPLVTITDLDTSVFNGGRLTVMVISGASSRDRLGISSQGQVVLAGTNVFFTGILVGRLTPGVAGSPLIVDFNSSASLEAVQAVARSITFQILGPDPVAGDRVASFQVTDGAGGSSSAPTRLIVVQINNQPPVNTVPTVNIQAVEDTPVAITGLSVADPDASLLPIQVTLTVEHGTLTIDTSLLDGVTSVDVSGNGTNRVVLTADQDSINATLQSPNGVIYQGNADYNSTDDDQNSPDQLTITTSDQGNSGPGGVLTDTDSVFIDIQAVFDTARITPSDTIATNTRGNEALLDSNIKAALGDNQTDLTGAILSINVTAGRNRSDRLRLMNEGRGEGQINVVSAKKGPRILRLGTLKIGTITGGENGVPLKIVFNANATLADLQHVLRLVTFRTAVQTTVFGLRTVTYSFTDALGLTSAPATKQVDVVRS